MVESKVDKRNIPLMLGAVMVCFMLQGIIVSKVPAELMFNNYFLNYTDSCDGGEIWEWDGLGGACIPTPSGGSGLTQEQVEDFAGGMYTGNTEIGLDITYEDGDGTIDAVLDEGYLNDTIDARTVSITHVPATIQTVFGTPSAGSELVNVQIIGDGLSYNVTEANGADPLEIYLNFTDVENYDSAEARIWYSGGSGHEVLLEVWNDDESAWEQRAEITDQMAFVELSGKALNPASKIDVNGVVQLRFRHASPGIAGHIFRIDYFALIDGFSSSTTFEHDALSGRGNFDTNHPDYASNLTDLWTRTEALEGTGGTPETFSDLAWVLLDSKITSNVSESNGDVEVVGDLKLSKPTNGALIFTNSAQGAIVDVPAIQINGHDRFIMAESVDNSDHEGEIYTIFFSDDSTRFLLRNDMSVASNFATLNLGVDGKLVIDNNIGDMELTVDGGSDLNLLPEGNLELHPAGVTLFKKTNDVDDWTSYDIIANNPTWSVIGNGFMNFASDIDASAFIIKHLEEQYLELALKSVDSTGWIRQYDSDSVYQATVPVNSMVQRSPADLVFCPSNENSDCIGIAQSITASHSEITTYGGSDLYIDPVGNNLNPARDNAIYFGDATHRWKAVYAVDTSINDASLWMEGTNNGKIYHIGYDEIDGLYSQEIDYEDLETEGIAAYINQTFVNEFNKTHMEEYVETMWMLKENKSFDDLRNFIKNNPDKIKYRSNKQVERENQVLKELLIEKGIITDIEVKNKVKDKEDIDKSNKKVADKVKVQYDKKIKLKTTTTTSSTTSTTVQPTTTTLIVQPPTGCPQGEQPSSTSDGLCEMIN